VIGTILNQRFALEKELGRGGMGAVYRATDQILQRAVAIKVLNEQAGDEFGKRIRLEAQILARLLHDHVVRLYDFGEADGAYFLVMEEVVGSNFHKRWRKLPLAERLRVVAQVADALDYAHHQGVIHRDVKPANVLLTATDQAKLSDFGLSLMAESKSETKVIRGTPQYMSPEQGRGRRLDHRTDLYSLGVMLYECATGHPPFQGLAMAVIGQHIKTSPVPPRRLNPELSPELEVLILSLLAKDPDDRPASGQAVARLLRDEIEQITLRPIAPTAQWPGSRPVANPGTATIAELELDSELESAAPVPVPTTKPMTPVPAVSQATAAPRGTAPLAREMLDAILAGPIALSPDERYLCGHYLAYLLGGSRRRGFLLRRPLDPLNADRARLLLAMTWVTLDDAPPDAIDKAVELLETRPDVRPSLNPIVVAKYLVARSTPARRKRFRRLRKQLQEASAYAREHMTDANGVLNPGLMPQTLDDLHRVAPARVEVDDQVVGRWNRIADIWRTDPDFRQSVLRYATRSAHRDPAGAELWPEVVYPLIERARWHRRSRGGAEALWDNLCARLLHVPDAGVRLDRAIHAAVPSQVAEKLDLPPDAFEDDPQLGADPVDSRDQSADRFTDSLDGSVGLEELAPDAVPAELDVVELADLDPIRFTLGDLRELWKEALAARQSAGVRAGHRSIPIGPYRLSVIPSVRGRSAGEVVIQGMPNKQIELMTPSLRGGGSASKPILAVWVYLDHSLVIAYVDFRGTDRYMFWHAPTAHQSNIADPVELDQTLDRHGLEPIDGLDRALSKRFRPRNPA